MEQQNQNQPTESTEPNDASLDSLEAQTTTVESGDTPATGAAAPQPEDGKKGKKKGPRVGGIAGRFNIYLLGFIFVLVVAGVVTGISILRSKQLSQQAETQIITEPLSKEALEQLRQTDVKVGDPKQILSVESNAVFAGRVLVRGGLEVAGELKAGTQLTLPGLTVTGNTTLGAVQANTLQVAGNTTLQGQVSIQNNLTVAGNGTFGGTLSAAALNIQTFQVNGDLQFSRHIDAGGGTPGKTDGSALGSGGTSSVSGTDTAGTVAINTGGGPGPGCFVTVNFTQRFNSTPHVVITPVGSAAGGLNYYINRSATNFSVCTASAAPAGSSFAFDYIVID
jgi:hypothetical protein